MIPVRVIPTIIFATTVYFMAGLQVSAEVLIIDCAQQTLRGADVEDVWCCQRDAEKYFIFVGVSILQSVRAFSPPLSLSLAHLSLSLSRTRLSRSPTHPSLRRAAQKQCSERERGAETELKERVRRPGRAQEEERGLRKEHEAAAASTEHTSVRCGCCAR
eukprot:1207942-Rhodomonas_salina.1